MTRLSVIAFLGLVVVCLATPVGAQQSQDIVLGSHYGFSGTISKIESGMLFIKTDSSLQPRAISPNKADRVGLYNAKVGDSVNMLVDSGNVLIDASSTDRGYPDHVFVVGTVHYSDPYW